MSEIIETRGAYRAVLHLDPHPEKPDGDYFGTVFTLDGYNTHVLGTSYAVGDQGLADVLGSAWHRFRDIELVERYMRIFHDVVGFDSLDRRSHKWINLVTRADLKMWGFESVEEYRTQTGHEDPSHGDLDDWEAWGDGNVWYYTIEKSVHWTSDEIPPSERDTWEAVDSCGGFYGDEYAREAAIEALGAYALTDGTAL